MDKIVIKCSGLLYAGEHKSDYLYIDNFMPKDGSEYTMRIKASDGKVYLAEFKDGKTSIEQCLIPLAGHLTAELCERIADEYISLSGVFMFPVFDSIQDTGETPPTYEQAKTLAERAIEAAEKAEEIAENIGTGGGTGTGADGKSAYEIAVDNGFEGTEEEWLESLKGGQGDKWEKIVDVELTESTSKVIINVDLEGNEFELSKALIFLELINDAEQCTSSNRIGVQLDKTMTNPFSFCVFNIISNEHTAIKPIYAYAIAEIICDRVYLTELRQSFNSTVNAALVSSVGYNKGDWRSDMTATVINGLCLGGVSYCMGAGTKIKMYGIRKV